MSLIFFKKPLFEKIKQGQKRSTLRLKSTVRDGDQVTLACGKELIKAQIIKKSIIQLNDICSSILKNEGFGTYEELLKVLAECYPGRKIQNLIYLEFQLI